MRHMLCDLFAVRLPSLLTFYTYIYMGLLIHLFDSFPQLFIQHAESVQNQFLFPYDYSFCRVIKFKSITIIVVFLV